MIQGLLMMGLQVRQPPNISIIDTPPHREVHIGQLCGSLMEYLHSFQLGDSYVCFSPLFLLICFQLWVWVLNMIFSSAQMLAYCSYYFGFLPCQPLPVLSLLLPGFTSQEEIVSQHHYTQCHVNSLQ